MDEELEKKILKIGESVLDELDLHREEVVVTMRKNAFDEYTISNPDSICHISEEELISFGKHMNEFTLDEIFNDLKKNNHI